MALYLTKSPALASIYVCTSAALGQFFMKNAVLLWAEAIKPWCT